MPIYQIVVGKNNVKLQDWRDVVVKYVQSYPYNSALQVPYLQFPSNKYLHRVQGFILEYLPAYLVDLGRVMFRRKPMMLKYNQIIADNVNILSYFLSHEWEWETKAVEELHSSMSDDDKKHFSLLAHAIDWPRYIQGYVKGTQKYLMKEDPEGYPAARRNLFRLRLLGYCIQGMTLMMLWRIFLSKTAMARNLWHLFMSLLFKFLRFFQISSTLHKTNLFKF